MKQLFILCAVSLGSVVLLFAAWLYASSLHSYFCVADESPVICLRSWINPLAAIFTVIAIWYAARQVIETRRQSLAATRESLVLMRSDLENALIPVLQIKDELYSRVPFFQEKWAGDHGDYIPRFVEYYPSPFGFERQFIENILTRKNFHYEIMKLRSTTNLPLKLEALMFELEDAAKFNPYTFFPGTTSALYDNATWKESVELEKLDKPEITVESIEVDGVEYQYYSDPASECYQSVFACFHEIDIALNNLLKELLIEKKTINAALTEVDNELTEESRKRVSDLRQKAKKKGRDFRF